MDELVKGFGTFKGSNLLGISPIDVTIEAVAETSQSCSIQMRCSSHHVECIEEFVDSFLHAGIFNL